MTELDFGAAIVATRPPGDGHGFVLVDPTTEGESVAYTQWASGDERSHVIIRRSCPPERVQLALDLWETVGRGEAVEATHTFVALRGGQGVTIAPLETGTATVDPGVPLRGGEEQET